MSSKDFKNNILNRPEHPDGMTVPPGYFADFARNMADNLPPTEFESRPTRVLEAPTPWKRIRPFLYMAAMFAGIWCMMKMFSMIHNTASEISFDRNPVLTAAISNDDFVYDFVSNDVDEDDILDQMYNDGINVSDLTF